jgi:hypothetical protein
VLRFILDPKIIYEEKNKLLCAISIGILYFLLKSLKRDSRVCFVFDSFGSYFVFSLKIWPFKKDSKLQKSVKGTLHLASRPENNLLGEQINSGALFRFVVRILLKN